MRATIVALAVGVALAAAQIARADGPVITESTTTDPPRLAPSISATCGFNVLEAITVDIRALSYFDADGNLTRRIAHVTVDGIYIKESTGEALPNRAVWTQIRDVEASTLTITGLRESIQRAGEPPSAVMVGRLVLPAFGPNGLVAIEQTPRIDFFEFWADLCTSFTE